MHTIPAMQTSQLPITQPSTSATTNPVKAEQCTLGKPEPDKAGIELTSLSERSINKCKFPQAPSMFVVRLQCGKKNDDMGSIDKSPGGSQQSIPANPAAESKKTEEKTKEVTLRQLSDRDGKVSIESKPKKISQHPLLSACQSGDIDTFTQLLTKTPHLANQLLQCQQQTVPPLIIASRNNQQEIMIALLTKWNANPNQTTATGTSPLLAAARSADANQTALKILLDHGANVNHQDKLGETPLIAISRSKKTTQINACAALLLKNGADPRKTDYQGLSPLTVACITNQGPEVIDTLLKTGIHVNQTDDYTNTPLIYASYHGNSETIQRLLDCGAIPNPQSHYRLSALYVPGKTLVKGRNWRVLPCLTDTPAKLVRRTRPTQLPQWLEKRWYSPEQICARNQQRQNARHCLDLLQAHIVRACRKQHS